MIQARGEDVFGRWRTNLSCDDLCTDGVIYGKISIYEAGILLGYNMISLQRVPFSQASSCTYSVNPTQEYLQNKRFILSANMPSPRLWPIIWHPPSTTPWAISQPYYCPLHPQTPHLTESEPTQHPLCQLPDVASR